VGDDIVRATRDCGTTCLDGFAQVKEYAERQREINQQYLCITDHGVMGAVPQQVKYGEKYNLNPIFGCLPAGTPIITKFGVKNIEDIKVGELVLTHTGSYQKVLRTSVRPYKGQMYEIKLSDSSKSTTGFRLTDEHPVLIRNNTGERDFVRADDIVGGRPTTKRGIESWNSYVCFPRKERVFRQADFVKLEEYLPEGKCYPNWDKLKGKEIIWSVHLARLLGLYTAEGSVRTYKDGSLHGVVTFSFSSGEKDSYVDETCDLLQKVFGIEASVHDRSEKSLCEVIFCCLPVAYFFAELCGIGSHNKKVPMELRVMRSENLNEAYLSGLLDGDAKNPNNDVNGQSTMRTSSRDVAFGMKILLADLGEWANVTRREEQGKVCYNVPYSPRRSYARFLADDKYVYKPIREVISEYVECDVFNIEVENDNSYVSDFVIHNCELYVNRMQPKVESRAESAEFRKNLPEDQQKKFDKSNHLLAIAYTSQGYSNLVRLTSWAWIHGYYRRPRVNHDILKELKEGIIFTTTCGNSEIATAFFEGGDDAGFQVLEQYIQMFGSDNFYLELMMLDWVKQKPYDEFLIRAHEKYGLPLILTQDCHYCKKEHSHNQRLMLMQQNRRTVNEINALIESGEADDLFELQDENLWLKSEDELNFKWETDYQNIIDYELYKQAKANTILVCERTKGVEIDRSIKLPMIPNADEVLREEIVKGFKARHCPDTPKYAARIKEEYELICSKGFASYFLIQKQMTDEARRVGPEILGFGDGSECVGPGRGSACGSLVAYCLMLHDVEPIHHDLKFSRFLSPARGGKQLRIRHTLRPIPHSELAAYK